MTQFIIANERRERKLRRESRQRTERRRRRSFFRNQVAAIIANLKAELVIHTVNDRRVDVQIMRRIVCQAYLYAHIRSYFFLGMYGRGDYCKWWQTPIHRKDCNANDIGRHFWGVRTIVGGSPKRLNCIPAWCPHVV